MKRALLAAGGLALGLVAACSDSTTSPAPSADIWALSARGPGPGGTVSGLERSDSLPEVVKSVTVDANGGRIDIPERGFRLTIPKGAVRLRTRITVTALAGTMVAYEFEPHGTIFLQPLTFEQEMGGTKGKISSASQLRGGYFSSLSNLMPGGTVALVNELFPVQMDGSRASFKIWHFSGYLMSTGRSDTTETPPDSTGP